VIGHPIGYLFTYKVFFEIVSKKVLNSCVKCIEMHDFTIKIGIYPDKIKCKFSVYRCIDIYNGGADYISYSALI
jgi:hypothetical protein